VWIRAIGAANISPKRKVEENIAARIAISQRDEVRAHRHVGQRPRLELPSVAGASGQLQPEGEDSKRGHRRPSIEGLRSVAASASHLAFTVHVVSPEDQDDFALP
jgi:hypothetical protein